MKQEIYEMGVALVIMFVLAFIMLLIVGLPAHSQNSAVSDPFWNSYYAAQGQGPSAGTIIANQKNTEAMVNEMRAARGQPPCSIGLIGQWQGRPAC